MVVFRNKRQLRILKGFREIKKLEQKRISFFVVLIILIIAFVITSQIIFALFSDYTQTNANLLISELSVALQEDAPFDDLSVISDEGVETNIKVFRVKSTGDVPIYARVKIIPIVEIFDNKENAWTVANIDINSIDFEITAENWIENGGYYYYKDILNKNDITKDVTIKINELSNIDYENKTVRITIKVLQESAQVTNDLWKDIFGITSYPQ